MTDTRKLIEDAMREVEAARVYGSEEQGQAMRFVPELCRELEVAIEENERLREARA